MPTVAAAFDLAAGGNLPVSYPKIPVDAGIAAVPTSLIKAIGWVESGWRQYTPLGRPLVSFDFGYGIMQITSGMAGAFGSVRGKLPADVQTNIASQASYNIAYGVRLLVQKWQAVPTIGDGNPATLENWYYAVWAYNGWGWVNNPNNPRFSRSGNPADNPSEFPYQERVLYLVAHPPRTASGLPLWQPVPVSLPSPRQIGSHPSTYSPSAQHRQVQPLLNASYRTGAPIAATAGTYRVMHVRITNTGSQPWPNVGDAAVGLSYHVLTPNGDPTKPLSPFSRGVVAFGLGLTLLPRVLVQGQTVILSVAVAVPSKVGRYQLVWDLEQSPGNWFSQLGVLPGVQRLVAISPGDTPTPVAGPVATGTPVPVNGAQFVADTSIPDGTSVVARSSVLKGWLLYNNGRQPWQANWALRLDSGNPFGHRDIAVSPVSACRSVNLVMSARVPRKLGRYRSVWRMRDGKGHSFGEPITLVVNVRGGSPRPTPQPSPVTSATPKPAVTPGVPTPTATPVG